MGCVADGSGCDPRMAEEVLLFLLWPFLKGVLAPEEGSSPTGEVGEERTSVFRAWTSAWRTSI